jgi:hypothetical protein
MTGEQLQYEALIARHRLAAALREAARSCDGAALGVEQSAGPEWVLPIERWPEFERRINAALQEASRWGARLWAIQALRSDLVDPKFGEV